MYVGELSGMLGAGQAGFLRLLSSNSPMCDIHWGTSQESAYGMREEAVGTGLGDDCIYPQPPNCSDMKQ